ncbi:hypothetical protein FGB62_25g136 [Gracilaria domingensis]|nr:hypothetical protein FGB62_25g136 [Gracilaria domingensis]
MGICQPRRFGLLVAYDLLRVRVPLRFDGNAVRVAECDAYAHGTRERYDDWNPNRLLHPGGSRWILDLQRQRHHHERVGRASIRFVCRLRCHVVYRRTAPHHVLAVYHSAASEAGEKAVRIADYVDERCEAYRTCRRAEHVCCIGCCVTAGLGLGEHACWRVYCSDYVLLPGKTDGSFPERQGFREPGSAAAGDWRHFCVLRRADLPSGLVRQHDIQLLSGLVVEPETRPT